MHGDLWGGNVSATSDSPGMYTVLVMFRVLYSGDESKRVLSLTGIQKQIEPFHIHPFGII